MRCAEIVTNYLLFQILFLFNAGLSFGEDRKIQHWSFVPPKPHTPPEVSDKSWLTNEIDNFILLKLEKNGLEPAAPRQVHINSFVEFIMILLGYLLTLMR